MKALPLHGRHLTPLSATTPGDFLARVTERVDVPMEDRSALVLLARTTQGPIPQGFRAVLVWSPEGGTAYPANSYGLAPALHYLREGDLVRIDASRSGVTVLFRRNSPSNSLLVTERCDNYCLMCSQPPKERDDSWLVDEIFQMIPLIAPATKELGITGGEPTLLGARLLELVETLKNKLPSTALHILSNGRSFAGPDIAAALGRIRHPDLMIGIPLYSDLPEEHDFVVQARGAFSETVRGILALKAARVRVEIRMVIHAETFARLPQFAEFVARNLLFADHVALMGLELMGFAKANLERLWIDPLDYRQQLVDAVRILDRAQMPISIYNHQRCVLPEELYPFARKSISDWKNGFAEECAGCADQDACGGFFVSSDLRKSRGIRKIYRGPVAAPSLEHGQRLGAEEGPL